MGADHLPTAVPDPDTGELIFDAEVAEIHAYTVFTGRKKAERVTDRLIVRRVRDLAIPVTVGEQGELFSVWRYHRFFTDNPAPVLQAEEEHRHHTVVEQIIADSKAARRLTLHLPQRWPWQDPWTQSFAAVHAPPEAALRP
ncbi:hypothetical protein [Streptomyces sp. NPDC003006]